MNMSSSQNRKNESGASWHSEPHAKNDSMSLGRSDSYVKSQDSGSNPFRCHRAQLIHSPSLTLIKMLNVIYY